MKAIWVIAKNTYKEVIRDRILYGLVAFAVLLVGLSLALGQLSFAEQVRISANFGLAAIHLGAVILAVFVGSTLVAKEIDKKTVLTLLARPITRLQFLIGKCMGLTMVMGVVIGGFSVVLIGVFLGFGLKITASFYVAVYGVLLEALILLGIALVLSTFSRPVTVVILGLTVFIIGHWLDSMAFFAQKSDSYFFKGFDYIIQKIFPNLEWFNWRSLFVYDKAVPWPDILVATGYAGAWLIFLTVLSGLIIRRKDFA